MMPATMLMSIVAISTNGRSFWKEMDKQPHKKISGCLHALHKGKAIALAPKENDILRFIFEQHEQGIQMTAKMVQNFVKKIMPGELHGKSRFAIKQVHLRLHHIGLMHRVSTHTMQ